MNSLDNFLVLYGLVANTLVLEDLDDGSKKLEVILSVNSSHSNKEYYDITFFNEQAMKFSELLEPPNRVTISGHLEKLENDELMLVGDQFIPHEYTKNINKDMN